MENPDITVELVTRFGDYYLKRTFGKILQMLDLNFTVQSTCSESYIEVRGGKIYFHICDINNTDTVSWLVYVDDNLIPVENYNVEYFADPEDDTNMIRKVVVPGSAWI